MKEISANVGALQEPKHKRKYKKKKPQLVPDVDVSTLPKGDDKAGVHKEDCPLHCSILESFKAGSSKGDVLLLALNTNLQQEMPLSADEVLALVEELMATLETELTEEDLLFKLAGELIMPFKDDLSEPYFFCEGTPFRAPSRIVEASVKHRFYKIKSVLPDKKVVRNVFDVLESKARFEGLKVRMSNRVAKHEGALYYDLCDKRLLKISSKSWEVVPAFPLFRQYKHQQAQVEPVSGGDPWELFDYLTIREEDKLLVMVFLISLFVADIAHPVLAVCGDQGSAKSFLCNIINRLIDPTLTERIIQPKNERDLIQTIRQKYVSVFDNISKIDQRVSDILCQACTGGGISYRQLYTDEGENIAQFRHVVIINSIRLPIVNADLMDRAIILKLQRITPENRKPEQDLWHSFSLAQPRILGGIFDILVKAMAIYPTVEIDKLPRLADFAKWGYAIAEALGKSGDQFLKDFSQNVKCQNESVVEKNVLCQAVIGLLEGKTSHVDYVKVFHKELKRIVGEDAKDETFPKLPHHLRGQLDLLRSTLQEHGITYQYFERQKNGVKILISNSSATVPKALPASQSELKSDSTNAPGAPTISPNQLISGKGEPNVADVAEIPTFYFDEGVHA